MLLFTQEETPFLAATVTSHSFSGIKLGTRNSELLGTDSGGFSDTFGLLPAVVERPDEVSFSRLTSLAVPLKK
jgi:hypothetical protein